MTGFIRLESYRTLLVLTPLTYLRPAACLTYGNDTDFRLTLHFRSSLLACACMNCTYAYLCLCFYLFSPPIVPRYPFHILELRWSLFFIGSTKPHTLLLLTYISVHYIPPHLCSCGYADPTRSLGTYALER